MKKINWTNVVYLLGMGLLGMILMFFITGCGNSRVTYVKPDCEIGESETNYVVECPHANIVIIDKKALVCEQPDEPDDDSDDGSSDDDSSDSDDDSSDD